MIAAMAKSVSSDVISVSIRGVKPLPMREGAAEREAERESESEPRLKGGTWLGVASSVGRCDAPRRETAADPRTGADARETSADARETSADARGQTMELWEDERRRPWPGVPLPPGLSIRSMKEGGGRGGGSATRGAGGGSEGPNGRWLCGKE